MAIPKSVRALQQSSTQGPRQLQQQQQVAASAHEPWLFSMALQASML
jgi:hypothetical protein